MPSHPVFAAIYDRLIAFSEKAGMSEIRAELLRGARGRTLELGAGTGHNLGHYGDSVTELVLTDPDPHMAKRLRARVTEARLPYPVEVVEAGAEQLPFEAGSFDTLVSTLVLCTVPDPGGATREAARVLAPGAELLLIEHVRGEEGSRLSRWQDRLERPWGWVAAGCHPNRDTAATLGASFDVSSLRSASFPKAPSWVEPLIHGAARPRAAE